MTDHRPLGTCGERSRTTGHCLYALTIAGSDSSAGAGVQADLATFSRLGVDGACCVTAVTAQDARGVQAVFPLPVEAVEAQLASAFYDQQVDCCKIGMLWSAPIAEAVTSQLGACRPRVVVLDPVSTASAGGALGEPGLQRVLERLLFPLCDVITPNIHEAEALLQHPIRTIGEAKAAASELSQKGRCAVVLKGGHLPSDPGTDLVCQGGEVVALAPQASFPGDFHGSGCVFSSALAVFLAEKPDLIQAARSAKALVSHWGAGARSGF